MRNSELMAELQKCEPDALVLFWMGSETPLVVDQITSHDTKCCISIEVRLDADGTAGRDSPVALEMTSVSIQDLVITGVKQDE